MATSPAVIGPASVPDLPGGYRLPDSLDLEVQTITAVFDGAGASGAFYACCSVYSQDGTLLSRTFPDQPLQPGDTAEVTYLPFSRRRGAAGTFTQAGFFTKVMLSGPWLYWPMQEAAGLVQDFSGNGFHSTSQSGGAPTYSKPGPFADGVSIGFPPVTGFDRGVTSYGPITDGNTWEMWVKPRVAPSVAGAYGNIFLFGVSTDARTNAHWAAIIQGVAFLADSVATYGLGLWYYLVLVRDGATGNFSFYINTAFDSVLGAGGMPGAGSAPVNAGTEVGGFGDPSWEADVCNCVYYARKLSVAEIQDHFLG